MCIISIINVMNPFRRFLLIHVYDNEVVSLVYRILRLMVKTKL